MHTSTKGHIIAARSFFRQMRSHGYSADQIIGAINEMLELVTRSIRDNKEAPVLVEAPSERTSLPPTGT
jgi:hypothetical protein